MVLKLIILLKTVASRSEIVMWRQRVTCLSYIPFFFVFLWGKECGRLKERSISSVWIIDEYILNTMIGWHFLRYKVLWRMKVMLERLIFIEIHSFCFQRIAQKGVLLFSWDVFSLLHERGGGGVVLSPDESEKCVLSSTNFQKKEGIGK